MNIPYRTQQNIKRAAVTLLILLVVGGLLWGLWFLWLQRYVVYTRDAGAVIDFELSETLAPGQEATPPEDSLQVEIHYNEGDDMVSISKELTQLKGYYITAEDLTADPALVWEQVQILPANTPIMLDMKSIYGDFYYATGLGRPISSSVNAAAVEELLANLKSKGYYTIARVPALRDRAYGLENVADGLPITGGYLWMDDQGCYWLNPNREGTISYLLDIASELRDMGFNEVVFDEFRFPETDQIIFEEDKQQALADTAKLLVTSCATDYFAVSFVSDGTWTLPEGKCRMYRTDISTPAEMMELMETLTLDNAAARLVFITNNMDARFEEYSVLRPANLAH